MERTPSRVWPVVVGCIALALGCATPTGGGGAAHSAPEPTERATAAPAGEPPRDETARDETARDETARDETARDETTREETARDAAAGSDAPQGEPAAEARVLPGAADRARVAALQAQVDALIDDAGIPDLVVLVGSACGLVYAREQGALRRDSAVRLASAAKWWSAAILARLVDQGVLRWESRVAEHVPWWPQEDADPRSQMTLEQALSMRAGFGEPLGTALCPRQDRRSLEDCMRHLLSQTPRYAPGSTFSYGRWDMQLAGLMAEHASGRPWERLVAEELVLPLGMSADAVYDTPSTRNPRLAGGARARPWDMMLFLRALAGGTWLGAGTERLHALQVGEGVTLAQDLGELTFRGWRYALGNWVECDAERWSAGCASPQGRHSSYGAFGFYPFWDRGADTFGVVVQDTGRGPQRSLRLGVALAPLVAELRQAWGAECAEPWP